MNRNPMRGSTIPAERPAKRAHTPRPPVAIRPPLRVPHVERRGSPTRDVARVIDEGGETIVDIIDNLLNRGVVLNADLILALAGVDLVYVRLSALLCAADRIFPRDKA